MEKNKLIIRGMVTVVVIVIVLIGTGTFMMLRQPEVPIVNNMVNNKIKKLETRPPELTIYKNEKYAFMIEYFTDKLAIERDFTTERIVDNPRLLFDALFYDSNYGVNIEGTERVPVIIIEVFECKEEDFGKCFDEIIFGPRRHARIRRMASSRGSSWFRIDDLLTHNLSFVWDSQETMRGKAVIRNQLLYIILVRTGSKNFKPASEKIFNEIFYSFRFIKTGKGGINPDLVVWRINWNPLYPTPEDTISFQIVVKNIGNKTSLSTKLGFVVANHRKGWGKFKPVESLEPLGKSTVFVEVSPCVIQDVRVKWHTLSFSAKADSNNQVSELNEGNNRKTVHIPFPF